MWNDQFYCHTTLRGRLVFFISVGFFRYEVGHGDTNRVIRLINVMVKTCRIKYSALVQMEPLARGGESLFLRQHTQVDPEECVHPFQLPNPNRE